MIYSSPQINKYPWLVRIIDRDGDSYNFSGFCGGTLVASKFVITAAHCLPGSTPATIAIRIGDHNLDSDTEPLALTPRTVNVVAINDHPDYNQEQTCKRCLTMFLLKSSILEGGSYKRLLNPNIVKHR